MKKIIKLITPPIITSLIKFFFNRNYKNGGVKVGFKNWEEASNNSTLYNQKDIFSKTLCSARLVRDGKAAYERDSVIFDKIQYDFKLLSSLLLISNLQNRLHLIDFGGALGSSFRQNKKYLDCLSVAKKWAVIEQSEYVDIGRNEFENDTLSFYNSLSEIDFDVDVVLLGSTLQYLEDPYSILDEIIKINPKYILITRTPFTDSEKEHVSIEIPPQHIYNASYPFWTLSYEKVIKFLFLKYELFEEWIDDLQGLPDESLGLLFKRRR